MTRIKRIARLLWTTVKRLAMALGIFVLLAVGATTVVIFTSGDDAFVYTAPVTLINDVTQMNPTHVARVIAPTSIDEVAAALRETTGPVSIGGGRFSQGGQVSYPDSVHLDMRRFNRVLNLDVAAKRVTVEPGITWRELQEVIDQHDLSIKIMQTYANFTVGGSLSVNVHGRYVGEGPLVRSVEAIKLVLADGLVVSASPTENAELYFGAIGGYGGIGVIVEATLQLADDVRVERRDTVMPVAHYRAHFTSNIRDKRDVIFHNADLYPPDFTQVRDVSWYVTDKPVTIEDRLIASDDAYVWQPRLANFVAGYDTGKWLRRYLLEPLYYAQDRVAWRNWEASYDVAELEPATRADYTYGLREYFIPVARFDEFIPRMREIFTSHGANIINVSVRHALPDSGTLLAWADEEVFAFVVYYRQGRGPADVAAVRAWSVEMIDAATALGGAYYLPYQVFETPKQFAAAYPRSDEYFALKARVDPTNRFRNRLLQQLYPPNLDSLESTRRETANYFRGEEQTYLTVPEWYLVWNPVEYADYLAAGNNPSDFPFLQSIDEYWTLYDRVRTIAEGNHYGRNSEYLTMLRVIGASTAFEYVLKGAYETTFGRFTRWTAGGEDTDEDRLIHRAHRAYADFIFGAAWYEYDFGRWLRAMWQDTPAFGPNFLRKLERRLFFTLEYGGKALYAKVIGFASRTAYGVKDDHIYFTLLAPAADSPNPAGVETVRADGRRRIARSLRWGPFTEAAAALAGDGFDFGDISGNRRIVVTAVGPRDREPPSDGSVELFESRVLSNEALERHVLLVETRALGAFLRLLPASGIRLEHVYDY
jgi:FAD/FMN-containing dehydrogenase